MNKIIFFLLGLSCLNLTFAKEQEVLNFYVFGNYIPSHVISQFTKETGIEVNVIECENNENLITKINTSPNFEGDLAVFSSYFLPEVLPKLQRLDQTKLKHQIHPFFLQLTVNPHVAYNLPFCWGTTGLIVNDRYFDHQQIRSWDDLWQLRYLNQLMILNDMRELFSIVLISLGYDVNDEELQHLEEAYQKILQLMPNVRVINLECVPNIYIDEDVTIGTAWSGDYKIASKENPHLHFVNPEPGFVLWYDCLVMLKNAPHKENAYRFLNFINRPEIIVQILENGYYSTNAVILRQTLEPAKLAFLLTHGKIQFPLSTATKQVYEHYWNKLRLE